VKQHRIERLPRPVQAIVVLGLWIVLNTIIGCIEHWDQIAALLGL
jgi:hypothetical protein